MPAITLQLSAIDDVGSLAIRAFSHGAYSHVDAVIADGNCSAHEAIDGDVPAGVQIRKPGYAEFSAIKHVVLPTTVECEAAFYAYLQPRSASHMIILQFSVSP